MKAKVAKFVNMKRILINQKIRTKAQYKWAKKNKGLEKMSNLIIIK